MSSFFNESIQKTFFDGAFFGHWPCGPIVPFADNTVRTTLYRRPMSCLAHDWQRSEFGVKGPRGGFLVEETEPRLRGGVIVEWDQIFAFIPPARVVPESTVYPIQLIVTTDGKSSLAEIPIGTAAKVIYEYFNDPAANTKPRRAWRALEFQGQIYQTIPKPSDTATWIAAEDSRIVTWKGNIVERSTPYIDYSALTISALGS